MQQGEEEMVNQSSPRNGGYVARAGGGVVISYKECLKNHAAAIGGNATDGCGEFMPSGEQGTLEALRCLACNCHRNFHRKEIDHGELANGSSRNRRILGHHIHGYPINSLFPPRRQMFLSYRSGSVPSESDEKDDDDDDDDNDGDRRVAIRPVEFEKKMTKKRFRTKFTEEQKQKMLNFAENAGWKMQKLEESAVQQFCEEIGIKRRVLKVWIHNNKHHYAKKSLEEANHH